MSEIIQPKILKGFRDFLPREEMKRSLLIESLTAVFRCSGFVPIDTPALEYADILLRKSAGETEKQVFRFTDNGGRDVALRFDLTVPFARFIAEHYNELYFPFKRYHIAKVWRGEKPQAGRYREFIQCDFDIVGSDCAYTDFEILSTICKSFHILGISGFVIHISHRGIFNLFLEQLGIVDHSEDILRVVDKLAKIGTAEVQKQLTEFIGAEKAEKILAYSAGMPLDAGFGAMLSHLEQLTGGMSPASERVRTVHLLLQDAGMAQFVVLDPSITRGLDYYTGLVYETFLTELPQIGSVCSGGRYDNLAGLYMKQQVSGVGASIGIDRLIAGLEQMKHNTVHKNCIDLLIFSEKNSSVLLQRRAAAFLEQQGIYAEVFPEPKKNQQQYGYAEKKGIEWGLFIEAENTENTAVEALVIKLKHLQTRSENRIPLNEVAAVIKKGAL